MLVTRSPLPSLRPFVKTLWVSETTAANVAAPRERVLGTGGAHLSFRLEGPPLVLYDDADEAVGRRIGHCIVGGPRAGYYVRDVSRPSRGVGAQLHPGAASLLFGVDADELAERHTALEEIWGPSAATARERLLEARSPDAELATLEALLAERLPRVRAIHPAVSHALGRFTANTDVGQVVKDSGYSHRRFLALFRRSVGLTPKLYCRVLRFQRVLARLEKQPEASWVDVALDAGYSDQPHFNHEFREFTGLSPSRYRRLAPVWSHHVPIPPEP
jgi:AraC-like DNA-binding protein